MKKLNKAAMFFVSLALVTAAGAQTAGTQAVDNWKNGTSELIWRSGFDGLCWRDNGWTPSTAASTCDGAIEAPKAQPVAAPAPPPEPVAAPAPAPVAAPVPVPVPPPAATKVTYTADAYFDFDKAVLKPEGKAKLDDLASKVKDINLEVVIAVGHTDSVGGGDYNQKLSIKRADAVKNYLVSKGIEKNRVYTEGKGATQPVADNKTKAGRAKNRRVEVEAVGTRAAK